jgi:hypothetical protein
MTDERIDIDDNSTILNFDRMGLNIVREALSGLMVFIISPDTIQITSPSIITIKDVIRIKDQGSILSISTFDRLLHASNSSKIMLLAISKICEICIKKQAKEVAVLGSQPGQRCMKVLSDISDIKVTNFPDGNQYAHLEKLASDGIAPL